MSQEGEKWWDNSLILIKSRGDFLLSKEMNSITKQIIASKGYEALDKLTSEIGKALETTEDELLR